MSKFKRVTMKEIATKAGVSRPAVSAALSDKASTILLSPGTREKIRRVAQEMGYRPNMLTRSFNQQKSYLIGFIGTEEHCLYALETIKGIQDAIETLEYSLLFLYRGREARDQASHLDRCLDRQVDGIIIAPAERVTGDERPARLAALRKRGLPIVQIYRKIFQDIPVVMTDDREIGRAQTRMMLGFGHRKIAHFTTEHYNNRRIIGNNDAFQRAQGYSDVMRDAGLAPLVITYPVSDNSMLQSRGSRKYISVSEPGYSGYAQMHANKIANHPAGITAVTTYSDRVAIGLIKGLHDLGVAVPAQISVTGFDNTESCGVSQPPLTTFEQPSALIGRKAAERIFDLLEGQAVLDAIFPPTLVMRESTAPPALPAKD